MVLVYSRRNRKCANRRAAALSLLELGDSWNFCDGPVLFSAEEKFLEGFAGNPRDEDSGGGTNQEADPKHIQVSRRRVQTRDIPADDSILGVEHHQDGDTANGIELRHDGAQERFLVRSGQQRGFDALVNFRRRHDFILVPCSRMKGQPEQSSQRQLAALDVGKLGAGPPNGHNFLSRSIRRARGYEPPKPR
jgi:hypothetical protein